VSTLHQDPDAPHGSTARARAGCECGPCEAALQAAEYAREYRRSGKRGRRRSRTVVLEGVTHGRIGSYVAGCGCDECRAVAVERRRLYRRGDRPGEREQATG